MLTPEMGFTDKVLKNRIGSGAQVRITPLDEQDIMVIQELLAHYHLALLQTDQLETAEKVNQLCQPHFLVSRFVKIEPKNAQGFILS